MSSKDKESSTISGDVGRNAGGDVKKKTRSEPFRKEEIKCKSALWRREESVGIFKYLDATLCVLFFFGGVGYNYGLQVVYSTRLLSIAVHAADSIFVIASPRSR